MFVPDYFVLPECRSTKKESLSSLHIIAEDDVCLRRPVLVLLARRGLEETPGMEDMSTLAAMTLKMSWRLADSGCWKLATPSHTWRDDYVEEEALGRHLLVEEDELAVQSVQPGVEVLPQLLHCVLPVKPLS